MSAGMYNVNIFSIVIIILYYIYVISFNNLPVKYRSYLLFSLVDHKKMYYSLWSTIQCIILFGGL